VVTACVEQVMRVDNNSEFHDFSKLIAQLKRLTRFSEVRYKIFIVDHQWLGF